MRKKQKSIQKVLAVTVLSLGILQLGACGNAQNKQASGTTENVNRQNEAALSNQAEGSSDTKGTKGGTSPRERSSFSQP